MWFIFDSHSPARHFKRGVPYDAAKDFPGYGKPPYDDITETDQNPVELMPFAPWLYKYVYENPSSDRSVKLRVQ
jgi:hypothetical protein